jgi:arylsulfatase A-like enzyme
VALAAFCLIVLGAGGCKEAPKPNILIVLVDAMRADRLGCYGYERGLTPFIDSLAARGTVFRRAYSQASWTNPSIASLITSRYQSQHGVTRFGAVLAESEITLAERLKENGYVTGGFSANGLIGKQWGFGQGYDKYMPMLVRGDNDVPHYRWIPFRAPAITKLGLDWLDTLPAGGPPVFLYMHYMETHTPYAPPQPILQRIFAGRTLPNLDKINDRFFMGNIFPLDENTLAQIEDVYDAEVAAIDEGLRELFGELEKRGFLRNAIVVVTADHGEEIMDHGHMAHKNSLYNEVIHVPLIVLEPGATKRVDVDDVVSLVDVAPTLLELLAAPLPGTFEGHSLTPLLPPRQQGWLARLRGGWGTGTWKRHPSFSELFREADEKRITPHERSVILGYEKMIAGIAGEREFYDLAADPLERSPDALAPADRAVLEKTLADFKQRVAGSAAPRRTMAIDPETKERMRALGYDE